MPKKKQHYIYVARDKMYCKGHTPYSRSYFELALDKEDNAFYCKDNEMLHIERSYKPFYPELKLKKGEQIRIPIDVNKVEKIK